MKAYWLKIVLGALGVFVLGMAGITAVRAGIRHARGVAESNRPISIPLGFLPFRVDGARLGSFERVVILRESPKEVTGVMVDVKASDSAAAHRLDGCALLARFDYAYAPARRGVGAWSGTEFECVRSDSAVPGAEAFGHVTVHPEGLELPLLLPSDVVADLRRTGAGAAGHGEVSPESAAAGRTADSIGRAASRLADSIAAVQRKLGDSIRRAVRHRVDSALAGRHRDSLGAARPRP